MLLYSFVLIQKNEKIKAVSEFQLKKLLKKAERF